MSDSANISGFSIGDLKLTLAQSKELLQDTVNRLQDENKGLRIKLHEKTSFISALKKSEQFYCHTCGLYGSNIEQHETHCKAQAVTLRGRTIELEAEIKRIKGDR